MASGVSVVVPIRGPSDTLGRLLSSLAAQTIAPDEVLVVDSEGAPPPASAPDMTGLRFLKAGGGRAAQRNFGAREARGALLLFIDSDMILSPRLVERSLERIRGHDLLCFREYVAEPRGYWARARAFERDAYYRTERFEAARGFRRDAFESVGGYNEAIPGMEDMDLHFRAIRSGLRLEWVDEPIFHDESAIGFQEYLRKRRGRSFQGFARQHPARWRELSSPPLRLSAIIRGNRHRPLTDFFTLLPGVFFLRSAEILSRRAAAPEVRTEQPVSVHAPPSGKGALAPTGPRGRISVIIPTRNSARLLGRALESVSRQGPDVLEVIVVDGGSVDGTSRVAIGAGARFVPGHYSRSSARAEGARQAQGEFLLFLDSDQALEPGVIEQGLLAATREPPTAIIIPELDNGRGLWALCRAWERDAAANEELSYPRIFPREPYVRIGGHSEDLQDFMEDRDLWLRWRSAGFATARIRARIVNEVGEVDPIGLGIKGFRDARDASAFFARNATEGIVRIARLRLQALLARGRKPTDARIALVLPLYLAFVYGPRFLAATWGSLVAFGHRGAPSR